MNASSSDTARGAPRIAGRPAGLGPLRHAWYVLRSLVYWVWQIAVTLLFGLPVLFGSLISFDVGYRWAVVWNRANVFGLKWICGVDWRVEGREHVPDVPCLVLCKHQSTWETYFLALLFRPAAYVAKRSLARIPIFGQALVALDFILIDRAAGRNAVAQMIEQGRDRLARGRWIVMFPEGTRRAVDTPSEYRQGGAIVSRELGAPICPVAVDAGHFWPRMGFVKWPGTITVRVLPAVHPDGRGTAEIVAEVAARIEEAMADMPTASRATREVARAARETADATARAAATRNARRAAGRGLQSGPVD